MPGHVLVIPKKHVGALFELSWLRAMMIFWTALCLQKKMIKVFAKLYGKPAGCDISLHTRPFMEQTNLSIPGHAHFHLCPRFWRDPYYAAVQKYETGFFQELTEEEKERFRTLLA